MRETLASSLLSALSRWSSNSIRHTSTKHGYTIDPLFSQSRFMFQCAGKKIKNMEQTKVLKCCGWESRTTNSQPFGPNRATFVNKPIKSSRSCVDQSCGALLAWISDEANYYRLVDHVSRFIIRYTASCTRSCRVCVRQGETKTDPYHHSQTEKKECWTGIEKDGRGSQRFFLLAFPIRFT